MNALLKPETVGFAARFETENTRLVSQVVRRVTITLKATIWWIYAWCNSCPFDCSPGLVTSLMWC